MKRKEDILWYDRKRTIFGLPLSFTKYYITKDRLYISKGFLNTSEEEIKLYRIMDVTLNRSLGERMFGLGTIHVCSSDKTTPEFDIKRIKKSNEIRDLLSNIVEEQRVKNNVLSRELLGEDDFDNEVHNAH